MNEHCKQNRAALGIVVIVLMVIVAIMNATDTKPKEKPVMPDEKDFLNLSATPVYLEYKMTWVTAHDLDRDGSVDFCTEEEGNTVIMFNPKYREEIEKGWAIRANAIEMDPEMIYGISWDKTMGENSSPTGQGEQPWKFLWKFLFNRFNMAT